MTGDDSTLASVNWVSGMLLAPEHFNTQDRFIEASFGWLLRYCVPASGLVGAGVRAGPELQGLAAYDPRFEVHDDGRTLSVTILQARGISAMGEPIDIAASAPVRGEVSRSELAGIKEALVYVVYTGERVEDAATAGQDVANPTMAALRRPRYDVRFGVPADVIGHVLVIGKVRRASDSLAFERDTQFIPSCATMSAHSELHAGWSRVQADLGVLGGSFGELHRAIARYAEQVSRRGVDSGPDLDLLAFAERTVLALDHAAAETSDAIIEPRRFFDQIDRLGRRVALALDLSSSTQSYFQTLAGSDASYTDLLEEQRALLAAHPGGRVREDLRQSLARADDTLRRIRQIAEALEGKYIDYRINRSLDALKFLLDRQGDQFYISVATPGHPQREGELLTFVFNQLALTGRHEYRLVLLGDPQGASSWQVGDELRVDLRINADGAPGRPLSRVATCEIPGQRNFGVNFETPVEVATISGISAQVQPASRIRGAILFQRRLGLVAPTDQPVAPHLAPAAAASPAPTPSPTSATSPRIVIRKPRS